MKWLLLAIVVGFSITGSFIACDTGGDDDEEDDPFVAPNHGEEDICYGYADDWEALCRDAGEINTSLIRVLTYSLRLILLILFD